MTVALGIAVAITLVTVALVIYLRPGKRRRSESPGPHGVNNNLTGPARPSRHAQFDAPDRGSVASSRSASGPARGMPILPPEFTQSEIQALLRQCPLQSSAHGVLLLNGVSPYELPLLHGECFDTEERRVEVPGANRRMIGLSETHWAALQPLLARLHETGFTLPVGELDQTFREAARHLGLGAAADASCLALWHSYVLYLVRQGIAPADLSQRIGAVIPEVGTALRDFAPPGMPRPLDAVQFEYPLQTG